MTWPDWTALGIVSVTILLALWRFPRARIRPHLPWMLLVCAGGSLLSALLAIGAHNGRAAMSFAATALWLIAFWRHQRSGLTSSAKR